MMEAIISLSAALIVLKSLSNDLLNIRSWINFSLIKILQQKQNPLIITQLTDSKMHGYSVYGV